VDSISIFIALALIICAGVIVYFLNYKTKVQPKTDTLFTEALNAMVKAEKKKAISLLTNVVKQDSDHVRAYLQLGNILREDNPEQAVKIHQSLTVRPGLSPDIIIDIHQSLALDYEVLEHYEKAKIEAEKIMSLEKRNLWALNFLLSIAEKSSDWDLAAKWSKQIQKITGKQNPNDIARFYVYRGLEKLKNGFLEEAKSLFLKGIKASPDYGDSYRYLGDISEQSRDLIKAVEYWESFAVRDINNASIVFSNIESALFDLGRYSEVEKFYRKILDNNPADFEAVIRLANVLDEKGESNSALNLVEDSIKTESDDVRADIMKLKLSITTLTPIELSNQIDLILNKLSNKIYD